MVSVYDPNRAEGQRLVLRTEYIDVARICAYHVWVERYGGDISLSIYAKGRKQDVPQPIQVVDENDVVTDQYGFVLRGAVGRVG